MDFNPVRTNQRPAREKIAERVWEIVRPIVFGCTPWFAHRWRIAWVRLAAHWFTARPFNGGGVSWKSGIARTARVEYPWNLTLKDGAYICPHCWVYAMDKISIGRNCCIGEYSMLLTGSHRTDSPYFDLITKPITIKDNAWVATSAIILPGVTIGEGAVVAAGAVVAKDVAPWTIVGGNPARFIKKRELHLASLNLSDCSNIN